MGLVPSALMANRQSGIRMPVPGGTVTMTTTDSGIALIPGPPRDLVVLESDVPVPVTIYSLAENLQGDGRPVSSTEVQIEWTNGNVTFTERWHPSGLVRNLTATHVRVSAVFYDAGYTSPRSTTDRVTAWACPGHAARPVAAKLWQIPTQPADPVQGVASYVIPTFATSCRLLSANRLAGTFWVGPNSRYIQLCEGDGVNARSLARSIKWDAGETNVLYYSGYPIPPGMQSVRFGAANVAWLGDSDWTALKFLSEV